MAEIISIDLQHERNRGFNPRKPSKRDKIRNTLDPLKTILDQNPRLKFTIVSIVLILIATPTITTTTLIAANNAQTPTNANLFLVVSKDSATPPDTVTVSLYERSCNSAIKSVEANFTYPSSKVQIQNSDAGNSAFSKEDDTILLNGLGAIGRSTTTPVLGTQLIEKFTLNVQQTINKNEFSLSPNSSITDINGKNILSNSLVISSLDQLNALPENKETCNNTPAPQTDNSIVSWLNSHLFQIFHPLLGHH